MQPGLFSILVPLYNEEEFVNEILERVIAAPLPGTLSREVVVVDDGSTDDSASLVEEAIERWPGMIRLFRQENNQGKGSAIRRAVQEARGEFCIIQDADLEYDPNDYMRVLEPLVTGSADAVYGSRFSSRERRRVLYFWHSVANRVLTTMANIAADINLTDMETCYKAFRTSLLKSIPIRSKRFGFEPEITIKLAKRQARIYEVPISYEGRTYADGKKIGLRDAVEAVFVILRYWASSDLYADRGGEILDAFSVTPRFNRWMADTIRPYIGKRVLEIGAGMGNLTRQLARRRERYIASDIDNEHLRRLEKRLRHHVHLETHVCDLSRADDFLHFAGEMDTVICLNVLEHVEDDLGALRNIRSALATGGRAVVLVPEGQSIYGKLDEVLGHFRRYSKEQLTARMEEAGFEVETVLNFNRISRPAWFVSGRILRREAISRLQLRIFDRLVWLWRRIDGMIPWKPTSIIAIARKPEA
jgi:glycosyltransferase involved in cell wall biosynthesis